jgi:putative transposase
VPSRPALVTPAYSVTITGSIGKVRLPRASRADPQVLSIARRQATHPPRRKPELVAEGSGRVWSWDITKLKGPVKGSYCSYYCLCTIIDIYSRYTVGWMLATSESKELSEQFLSSTVFKYGIGQGRLTIHSDRGSPMVAGNVAQMMSSLGVTKSHSRPKTSNDNPYSESQYKALKYRHDFPGRFGCVEDARAWCERFSDWYNLEHRHSGIAMHTPFDVHFASPNSSARCAPTSLTPSTPSIPNASSARPPSRPSSPRPPAWINKPDQPRPDEQTLPAQG